MLIFCTVDTTSDMNHIMQIKGLSQQRNHNDVHCIYWINASVQYLIFLYQSKREKLQKQQSNRNKILTPRLKSYIDVHSLWYNLTRNQAQGISHEKSW